MNRSLDLPDKTLQFIRDRPLMDEAVRPLSGGPLLVRRGALLTRIVVDRVLALDGQTHAVMFVGTGWNLDRLVISKNTVLVTRSGRLTPNMFPVR